MPFDQYGNPIPDAPMFGDALLSQDSPLPPPPDPLMFPQPEPGPQMFLDEGELAPPGPVQPVPDYTGLANLAGQVGGGFASLGQDVGQGVGQYITQEPAPPPEPARPPTLEELAQPANVNLLTGTGTRGVVGRARNADDQLGRDFVRGQVMNAGDTALRTELGGINEKAAADELAEQQRFNSEMEQGQLAAKQAAASRMADIDREVTAYRNMHISQGAALKKLGPVGNAANALAMFGEGFMNARYGIKTGATAAINAWMDRDIEIQKAEVAKQGQVIGEYRNLYDMVRQSSRDDEEARTKFHMMKLTELDAENQVRMAGYQSKLAINDGQKASVAITSQYENARLQLGERTSKEYAAAAAAEAKARAEARRAQGKATASIMNQSAMRNLGNPDPAIRQAALAHLGTSEEGRKMATFYAEAGGNNPKGRKAEAEAVIAENAVAEITAPVNIDGQVRGNWRPGVPKTTRDAAYADAQEARGTLLRTEELLKVIDKNGGIDVTGSNQTLSDDEQYAVLQLRAELKDYYSKARTGAASSAKEDTVYALITGGDVTKLRRSDLRKGVARFGKLISDDINSKMAGVATGLDGEPIVIYPSVATVTGAILTPKDPVTSEIAVLEGRAIELANDTDTGKPKSGWQTGQADVTQPQRARFVSYTAQPVPPPGAADNVDALAKRASELDQAAAQARVLGDSVAADKLAAASTKATDALRRLSGGNTAVASYAAFIGDALYRSRGGKPSAADPKPWDSMGGDDAVGLINNLTVGGEAANPQGWLDKYQENALPIAEPAKDWKGK